MRLQKGSSNSASESGARGFSLLTRAICVSSLTSSCTLPLSTVPAGSFQDALVNCVQVEGVSVAVAPVGSPLTLNVRSMGSAVLVVEMGSKNDAVPPGSTDCVAPLPVLALPSLPVLTVPSVMEIIDSAKALLVTETKLLSPAYFAVIECVPTASA
jgi:hypothetical protein